MIDMERKSERWLDKELDREIVSEKWLDKEHRVLLQRRLENGVPYSFIVVDGTEELSAPTVDEEKMLGYFREHLLWLWDVTLTEG